MKNLSSPHSPSRHVKQESLHIENMDRPSTPIPLATDQHDPDSPCMVALPTTPSRTTINVKPSMTTLHSPSNDLDIDIELDPSPTPPHYHHVYDGNKSAASSATAFDAHILHGSESYLIIDPRINVQHNDQATQDAVRGSDDTAKPKRKKVDFNKPLKFWLIFVSLCFSCLLSALDLVSLLLLQLGSSLALTSYYSVPNIRPQSLPLCRTSLTIFKVKTTFGLVLPMLLLLRPSYPSVDQWPTSSVVRIASSAHLRTNPRAKITRVCLLPGRSTMIISLIAFMLGSGLCGGARYVKSMDMLIAARAFQGMGGGGILAMTEISESIQVLAFDAWPVSEPSSLISQRRSRCGHAPPIRTRRLRRDYRLRLGIR